jgi:uncharacterized repeat protein (TIGR01451 family)
MDREIFHKGVALGAGGLETYKSGVDIAWKIKDFFGSAFSLGATTNPYFQWLTKNKFGASGYLISNEYYTPIGDYYSGLNPIASILFYDPNAPASDPQIATYSELPFAKYFPGGNNVYMRTGWTGNDTIAGLRANPAYTMTSHSDFDANTFLIYRKGNLSPDSGIYDAYANQSSYMNYQKQTYAHNDMLVIDPANPNGPTNISGFLNPGGTDYVSTKTFSDATPFGNQYAFVHNSKANWGDIVKFVTTPEYDYTVGDATLAYSSRLNEYYRNVAFLRKGTKAYMIVFDRVESNNANFDKRWLMHFVSEPTVNGTKISEQVAGHIDTYNGDLTVANNVYNTSAVYVKTLLPTQHTIRRIGGTGYEFYREGTSPVNLPVTQSELNRVSGQMGGPWQEAGTWRIELSPATKQTRDYFLNVMYIGDVGETMAPVQYIEENGMAGVIINDPALGKNKILFTKTGTPDAIFTNTSVVADTTFLAPNITLTKSANKSQVAPGEEITYTISYQNTGASGATNIAVTDPIPTGTTYVSNSATNGGTLIGAILTWSISSLSAGGSGSLSFKVKVNDEASPSSNPNPNPNPTPSFSSLLELKLDENSGQTTYDSSGNNNGTLANGSAWKTGSVCPSGSCLSFDGVNDYVDIANESNFDFERTASFSVGAWIKTSQPSGVIIAKEGIYPNYRGWNFAVSSSKISCSLLTNYYSTNYLKVIGNTSVNDGVWHYVSMTYNGNSYASGVKLYVDGILQTNSVIRDNLTDTILNNYNVRIGTYQELSSYFNGFIDNVNIYNYVLTSEQVSQLYNKWP